jgi:hypothetical protein
MYKHNIKTTLMHINYVIASGPSAGSLKLNEKGISHRTKGK